MHLYQGGTPPRPLPRSRGARVLYGGPGPVEFVGKGKVLLAQAPDSARPDRRRPAAALNPTLGGLLLLCLALGLPRPMWRPECPAGPRPLDRCLRPAIHRGAPTSTQRQRVRLPPRLGPGRPEVAGGTGKGGGSQAPLGSTKIPWVQVWGNPVLALAARPWPAPRLGPACPGDGVGDEG